MIQHINRQFRLTRRPNGRATADDFDFVASPVPALSPGQALVQVLYLSLDPTHRLWMSDRDQYTAPQTIGAVMRGGAIGRVIESASHQWEVGDLLRGQFGWQDYCLVDANTPLLTPLPANPPLPLPVMLGACGMTGITAYIGLLDLTAPKAGETVVVSAAAGAVGSIVGQIAKMRGCRVIGITGGPDKCRWLIDKLGFHSAVDYKAPAWRDALAAATPDGIDVDFENVGGTIMTGVMSRMKVGGRVTLCGLISNYNANGGGGDDFSPILMRRLVVRGFIVTDFLPRWPEATKALIGWVRDGHIVHRETIVDGLEHASAALNRLFDGDNLGKLMVKVSDP